MRTLRRKLRAGEHVSVWYRGQRVNIHELPDGYVIADRYVLATNRRGERTVRFRIDARVKNR